MKKFRVWDEETNTMHYPGEDGTQLIFGVTHVHGEEGYHIWQLWDEEGEVTREGKAELMQYTSSKDRHGQEIYEDDIFESYKRFVIKYDSYYGGYLPFAHDGGCGCCSDGESGQDPEVGEVIGNIYENPELLEVQK